MNLDNIRRINPAYFDFLVQWQDIVFYLIFAAFALALILWVGYKLKLNGLPSMKAKHDYISHNEANKLQRVHFTLAVSLFFFINWLEYETVALNIIWFFVRLFIGIAIAILYAYVARLLLKYFWPKKMHTRMRKLRYTPRVNPKTGNKMKLLSEAEEDAYLDEGKQAEENVFSVDYDVWIDEETGDTHIEKYDGRLSAEECDRCGFQTLKLEKEEILTPATDYEDGELQKEFKCVYCKRVKRRTVKLSKKMRDSASEGSRLVENPLEQQERVVAVKINIASTQFSRLTYEFSNLKEALKSDGMNGSGIGIESIKLEIFTNKDEHLKFQFTSLEEARKFMEQFDVSNVNE